MSQLFPTITPEKYTLSLRPNLETFTFHGEETVEFHTNKVTKKLVFHALEIVVEKAELLFYGKDPSTPLRMTPKISYDKKAHTVTFAFKNALPKGEKELVLSYSGVLGEKMKGWYRSEFVHDGKKHVMAVTQFEEIGGRQAFICIDEPAAKAVFDVTLIIPKDLVGVSNTIEDKEEILLDGYKRLHFVPTPRMSTYLLALLVGKFESIEKKSNGGVLVRAFATPGKKSQLEFALDVAAKCLDFYADYFNIAYPLPVLDLIAIPDFDAGAMENWGAVTFREAALLVDEKRSSLMNKQWVALVVAHELAHMWFGNLVTMEWWTHLWLNEGFACYIEYLAVGTFFPDWHMWKQFATMEHNGALALDSLASTHPIEVPIKSDQEVKEIFDEISYAKGASVIQMLATYLGPSVFRDGLRKYLKDNAYGNTVTEKLWTAFEEVSHQDIRKIMSIWTQKPGYPLVHAKTKNGLLTLSQERFFSSSIEREKNKKHTLWQIPLLLDKGGKEDRVLITKKSQTVLHGGGWVTVNSQEASVVRVRYSDKQYQLLEDILPTIPATDRMGIIRDVFDSSRAGYGSVVAALKLLPLFTNENEYMVWASISSGLLSIDHMLHECSAESLTEFAVFAESLFVPLALKMGWDARPSDTNEDILLRSLALSGAGKYGHEATIQEAQKRFVDHISGKREIDANLRGVVFALVAENGNEETWQEFVQLFQKEELHQEKNRIMMALCNFTQPQLIEKTLNWSMQKGIGEVRLQDKSRIPLLLFANPHAQKITWEFVKTHWSEYVAMYQGLHSLSRVIEGAGDSFSENLRADIAAFFKKHPVVELKRTMQQVLERLDSHIDWLKRDGKNIEAFLQKK